MNTGKGNTGKKGGQLNNTNAEKWPEAKAIKMGNDLIDWLNEANTNIFYKEFLLEHGLYKDVVRHLGQRFPSFYELIKKAQDIQEMKIVKWSSANKMNVIMSIFCLKNLHGWRDYRDLEITTKQNPEDVRDSIYEKLTEAVSSNGQKKAKEAAK